MEERSKNSSIHDALLAHRGVLVEECRGLREPQEMLFQERNRLGKMLAQANKEYEEIGDKIGEKIAGMRELERAYTELLGYEMPVINGNY